MFKFNIVRNGVQVTVRLCTLQWRHKERDCFSNHRRLNCLLNSLSRRIEENIKAQLHWSLWGDLPVTDGFPSQRASNRQNVSIWWRHHVHAGNPYYQSAECSLWAIELKLFTWSSFIPWWLHQMKTFSALLALCAGNPPTGHQSNKIWLCLVPTSTTRFAWDVGYRIGKNLIGLYKENNFYEKWYLIH